MNSLGAICWDLADGAARRLADLAAGVRRARRVVRDVRALRKCPRCGR